MREFAYVSITSKGQAVEALRHNASTAVIAGGTGLIDLMKLGVESPGRLMDINDLPLAEVEALPGGSVRIGAMVRNTELAYHPLIVERYPVLSQALLSGASPQLRNMASVGGNLMQRTRCPYFRDVSYACNKREPGSGCSALTGFNRQHAVLGTSDKCIATHPSDMDVALAALDAMVILQGAGGARRVALNDFYIAYGQDPARETVKEPGELIVAVELPAMPFARRSTYVKVRDRASYEFALASAAVAMDVAGDVIRDVKIALGGVATKPWRAFDAEKRLIGQQPSPGAFRAAAQVALAAAKPQTHNGFKIELARRTIVRALEQVAVIA